MRTLKEQPTASYGIEDKYDIGKISMWPNNYEEIVDVTRVPGTNTFHFTGKKAGKVAIDYENKIDTGMTCEAPTQCVLNVVTGIYVHVEQIGSIIHVRAGRLVEPDH